jgi:hypothetical protein
VIAGEVLQRRRTSLRKPNRSVVGSAGLHPNPEVVLAGVVFDEPCLAGNSSRYLTLLDLRAFEEYILELHGWPQRLFRARDA